MDQLRQQQCPRSLHRVWFLQPHEFRLRKCCIALLEKFAVLIFAHGIHRIAKMLRNVKAM
jgi:hypothetical protein